MISVAVARPLDSSMSRTATNAPISARRSEMPRPMPDAAPVTRATFSLRERRYVARCPIFFTCSLMQKSSNPFFDYGQLFERLLCRIQRAVHVIIRVGESDNRMQGRRGRCVYAKRKQRQHKFLEGRAVHILA